MAFDEYIEPLVTPKYTVRLLQSEEELRQYQDLRYKYLVMAFNPNADPNATDTNIGYDKETSQLCAFYKNPETGREEIVGGYILMRYQYEDQFCKATLKYDLSKLLKQHKFEICEATRAVTHPDHRNGFLINLLWEGQKRYVQTYGLRYIIGTMSFAGTDPLIYTEAASYLYHNYLMPEDIMVTPLPGKNAYFHQIIPKEKLCNETCIEQLPPLLKGFLRRGAEVGKGFYIDHALNTVETFAIFDMKNLTVQRLV